MEVQVAYRQNEVRAGSVYYTTCSTVEIRIKLPYPPWIWSNSCVYHRMKMSWESSTTFGGHTWPLYLILSPIFKLPRYISFLLYVHSSSMYVSSHQHCTRKSNECKPRSLHGKNVREKLYWYSPHNVLQAGIAQKCPNINACFYVNIY